MKLNTIEIPIEQIAKFCDRWQITEFALFGSILRFDFRPDSDIDILNPLAARHRFTHPQRYRNQSKLSPPSRHTLNCTGDLWNAIGNSFLICFNLPEF